MKIWLGVIGIIIGASLALFLVASLYGKVIGMVSAGEVAIKGYDPVAYFTEGRALKGNDAFTVRWHGSVWHFANKKNADLFSARPEAYVPQYDGYCAWAMVEARKARTDPEVWKIVNGKLYLNCSMSAYEKWSRDIPGNIKKADSNWKNVFGEH